MFKSLRLQQIIQRPVSKVDKAAYNIFPGFEKPKTPSCFPLESMISQEKLMKNSKFIQLINNIKQYNQNIQKFGEENIIQYKLYEFLYSCLCICNTKTDSQIQDYLDLVDNWFNKYNTKRGLAILQKKVKSTGKQEQIIRQTFKSNLPLEINRYNRKLLRRQLMKNDSEDSEEERSLSNDEFSLPAFRNYQMELVNMRKKKQQKEEQELKRVMKKNYSRVQSITSNNFYKRITNKNDVMRSKIITTKQPKQSKQNKENKENPTFFDTSMGFGGIKRYRLNQTLRKKQVVPEIQFPVEEGTNKSLHEDPKQNEIANIDGLCLLKNPFEVQKKTKLKTKKKK